MVDALIFDLDGVITQTRKPIEKPGGSCLIGFLSDRGGVAIPR